MSKENFEELRDEVASLFGRFAAHSYNLGHFSKWARLKYQSYALSHVKYDEDLYHFLKENVQALRDQIVMLDDLRDKCDEKK